VMCPDRKLKWFQDHGRNLQQSKSIKSMIFDYWENVYAGEEENELSEEENKPKRSRYAPKENKFVKDHIQTYLDEPRVSTQTIKEMGGYMMYWHNASKSRP
ncbi:hypothetical protein K443DRAFT_39129, partial [Laccaria amethystina LaAM-08-1]